MTFERADRNVYILGAGFSAPAGAPLVNDFLDVSRELCDDPSSGLSHEEQAQFKKVFDFKHRMAAAREKFVIDLDNIEDLFGLIEISNRLNEDEAQTRNDLIYLIAKTLQRKIVPPGHPARPKINFLNHSSVTFASLAAPQGAIFRDGGQNWFSADLYDYFAALTSGMFDHPQKRLNRKDTIITFNYDLVCDDAIRRIGFKPNYHVPEQPGTNTAESSSYIDILKLHGSINWALCPKCRSVHVLNDLAENPKEFRCCGANSYERLLVPPSWDKSEYGNVIKSVWSCAVEELTAATRICIVGYSMPQVDAFFKYLLTLALSRNDHLAKLIVVDPNVAIGTRYRDVLDPTFQRRRFVFSGNGNSGCGVTEFFANHDWLLALGRGELNQQVARYAGHPA